MQIPLMRDLITNNRSELALAMRNAASEVDLSNIQLFTQKGQYIRRMLDAMGEEQIRNIIGAMEETNDENLDVIKSYRDSLRKEVRNFVEHEYMLQAEGRNRQLSDEILIDVRLGNIERYYLDRTQELIKKMAGKLSKRYGRQIKRTRKGQIDISKTLRDSVAYQGVPVSYTHLTLPTKRIV